MKTVYQSKSGRTFEYPEDAQKEDRFVDEVDAILAPFRDKDIQPGEFVQRTEQQVNNLINQTYRLLVRYYGTNSEIPEKWKKDPRGIVGRYLDDGDSPAYPIVGIIWAIDNRNRQWQQPYYALAANRGEYSR